MGEFDVIKVGSDRHLAEGYHAHLCGWTPEEFNTIGYSTWTIPKYQQWADGRWLGAIYAIKTLPSDLDTLQNKILQTDIGIFKRM